MTDDEIRQALQELDPRRQQPAHRPRAAGSRSNWTITYRPGHQDTPRLYPPADCPSCEGSGLRRDRPEPDGPPRFIPVLEWQAANDCQHCKGTGNEPNTNQGGTTNG